MPLQAVNHEADRTTLFVVDSQDRIEDCPVTLGLQTANDVEVLSGVEEGQRIVISDRSALKPGEAVRPQSVQVMQYQEGTAN